ncbi:MAG: hypothetical protein AAGA30_12235 [Planctomycetota bacterium]
MKKFAILFAAVMMMAFVTSEASAQCRGGGFGGAYYGGSAYRVPAYRVPSVGFSYGSYRPVYRYPVNNFHYARPVYGNNFYRHRGYGGFGGYGYRGISIRF